MYKAIRKAKKRLYPHLKYPIPPWFQCAKVASKGKESRMPSNSIDQQQIESKSESKFNDIVAIGVNKSATAEWKDARDEYRRRRNTGMSRFLIGRIIQFWSETQAPKQVAEVDKSN